ncbi:MAG: DNA polymerase III subunit alpha [Actinobacteria bacterium]|nr:DNA polymerase III subunit alpha [Actinomycetota bacterium]
MKNNDFVHLHVHSEYSLLDGATRIKGLIGKAVNFGMPAVALTDHGVMYGAIEFYSTAKAAGIKPIIGCEVYVAPESRLIKQAERDRREETSFHLTLLAKNNTGYQNLMKLVSLGFIEGFYYKPRVDKELLQQYHEGIIALSGCIGGEIPRHIINGRMDLARESLQQYVEIFGRDDFYLELQDSGITEQKHVNTVLSGFSGEFKLKIVATNDVHYLNREDNKAHDVLLCIQTGSTINEKGRLRFPTDQYYFKSGQEMHELFKDFKGALENTIEIAGRCKLDLKFNLNLIPSFEVPDNYSPDEYLKKLCLNGAGERYKEMNPEINERIGKELEVIKKMGFSEYFLIVWDFVNFAKKNNIRVGPGRGSAAGSVVSYCLGITDIEPMQYDLLFERFLNEERRSMPDIDIDFCYEKRDQVIRYVTGKYGERRVAQLITFGTMAARQAIRDAGRVLEIPYSDVDRVAKMIPMELNMTIGNSLKISPELKQVYEGDIGMREVIDTAMSLEGISRQDSIHAAGVVISSEDLYNYTPIQKEGGTDIVTQYKMEDIQHIGLLKMDFLGLKTLSLIDKTLFLIEKTRGKDMDINKIPLDDQDTFRMLCDGECLGVFQLESTGMRELVINLKPGRFEDLIALLALYRPGPLQSGMVSDFVESKNGRKKISYLHPSLKPILESTYGIILYQEQVMRIASELAGFSMSEADILRGAISKKKRKLLSEQKTKFIEGAAKRGIDESISLKVFELVNHFAEYGFNKSHSAAYAMISYQTAYLKANYPVEFMAALLSIRMGNQEKVAQYVHDTRRLGITVLPPDVNESFSDFSVVKDSIRFGLSAIKNVGTNVIESIEKERKSNGKFKSFVDFCERVESTALNRKTIESLVKSGVFDSLGQSRKFLLENFEKIIEEILKIRREREKGQFSLFDFKDNDGMMVRPAGMADYREQKTEYPAKKLLNFEKEMLGLYISGHPLFEYEDSLRKITPISELKDLEDKSNVVIGGIAARIKMIYTKKDQQMCFMELEDIEDSLEVIVFPSVLEKYRSMIEDDRIIEIKGKLDKKEDQIKLIASEIKELVKDSNLEDGKGAVTMDMFEEDKNDKMVTFNIRKDDLDRELINNFYTLVSANPGDYRVEIRVVGQNGGGLEKKYLLPHSFRVNPDKVFMEEIEKKFSGKLGLNMPEQFLEGNLNA